MPLLLPNRSALLSIDIAAMANADHQNRQDVIFYFENDPVISHAVAPQPTETMAQRFAKRARIGGRCDAGFKVLDDCAFGRRSRRLRSSIARGSYSIVQAKGLPSLCAG